MPRVMVLTNREGTMSGIVFDGDIPVRMGTSGPFCEDALADLRESGLTIEDGDHMFFPEAVAPFRVIKVKGNGWISQKWSTSDKED